MRLSRRLRPARAVVVNMRGHFREYSDVAPCYFDGISVQISMNCDPPAYSLGASQAERLHSDKVKQVAGGEYLLA
jgi:hypothetical protein